MFHLGLMVLLVLAATPPNLQAKTNGVPPEILALHQAALKTQARLKTNAASWTCALQFKNGPRVLVSVLKTPEQERYVIAASTGRNQPDEISRLIIHNGVWYVIEGYNKRAYRPYEANFKLPETYYYLFRSDFQQVPDTPDLTHVIVDSSEGDIVNVREMPSELTIQRTRNSINELEAISAKESDAAKKAEQREMIAAAERVLKSGLNSKFSKATGMMLENRYSPCTYELRDFKWLDSVDTKEFAVQPDEHENFTANRSADSNEHVMICYLVPAAQSLRARELQRHAQVLDLADGKLTRVPFRGFFSQPGCFLKDRSRVIVFGIGHTNQNLAPYEVNLQTGANRLVGGEDLALGMCRAAALSPDGKTVAILHSGGSGLRASDSQVKLVNLATDQVRGIGKQTHYGSVAWLPDGTGLLLSVYDASPEPNEKGASKSTIVRMDLQGVVTPLFPGDWPVVLPTVNRILHDDRPRAWATHALDGSDPQPYLGGMLGHYFPTVSPDGSRLMFLRFNGSDPAHPYIFGVGERTGKPASAELGVWELATWR